MNFSNLPSLVSLRAFEAAARLGSFKLAADELCVTPAAIGAQIQSLEAYLNCCLFERRHRQVIATSSAKKLQYSCQTGFSTLKNGIEDFRIEISENTLTIGVGSMFAARWLSPKLSGFLLENPDTALRLADAPSSSPSGLANVDAAILWGGGKWSGLDADLILRPYISPIASDTYLQEYGYPEHPRDLLSHRLIYENQEYEGERYMWRQWFLGQGVLAPSPSKGTQVRDGLLGLQLMKDHQGVGLGIPAFLQPELQSGRLKSLFEPMLVENVGYYLVTQNKTTNNSTLSNFRNWLLDQF